VPVRNLSITIAIIASVIIIVTDTLFSKTIVFISFSNLDYFVIYVIPVFVTVFVITQYVFLHYTQRQYDVKLISGVPLLRITQRVVTIVQFFVSAFLILVTIEIVFQSRYDLILLKIILWLSYGLSFILLAFLTARFSRWLKSNYSTVVLAYAIATGALSINVAISVLYVISDLETFPETIRPVISAVMLYENPERPLATASVIISVVSFILTWLATTLLLRHHSKKLGRIKYWIAITLPLIYFLGQFQSLFIDVLSDFRFYDSVLFGFSYTIIFTLAKPLGGFLFGLAFWILAKKIQNIRVKDYLLISGSGFLILFAADQARTLVLGPYPPFGLVSISFMGLASYFILLGIYLSAVSVSQDDRLRTTIRKTVELEYDMLEKIAKSQMNEEIQNKVYQLWKKVDTDELPAEASLGDTEVKEYIDQVLQEVRENKKA
jgi:hypothetical protein